MFCLRSYPRCGTHMLRTALNNHPVLTCHGEIFHAQNNTYALLRHRALGTLDRNCSGEHAGFVALGYIPSEGQPFISIYEELWRLLRLFRVPMISLRRRDLLRRAASAQLANRHQLWRRDNKQQPATKGSVSIAPQKLLQDVKMARDSFEDVDSTFPWAHVVHYEDLLDNWQHEVSKIQTYLGVENQPITPTTHRQDSRNIRQIVKNFDELRDHFKHHHMMQKILTIAEKNDKAD